MSTRAAAFAFLPLMVALAAGGSGVHAAPAAAAAEAPERAHLLFDDTTGPWQAGIAVGAPAGRLMHPRQSASGSQSASSATPAASAQPPDPEVLGFAQVGEVTSGSWRGDLRMNLLSTIAYFGVNLNPDGSLVTADSGYQGWWSSQATDLINAAHSAGDRVVLTVKAFSNSAIAGIVGSESNRQRAAAAILWQVVNRGADGVNVDFEGTDSSVAGNFTTFVGELRAVLNSNAPQQSYLTVDTYASAASGGTMFDIPGLASRVDVFDVMAYDITSPGAAHAGPVAPLDGVRYADTNVVNDFLSLVPATQVVLGVPYYGYKWSTASGAEGAATTSTASADTYSAALDDIACAGAQTRWDATYASPWASWFSPPSNDPCGGNHNSWRELFFENPQSLGAKYDLVNNRHLRGIGIWSLGYDRGHAELWDTIAAKFTVTHAPTPQMAALPATESSTAFTLQWSVPSGGSVASFRVFANDGRGWQKWGDTSGTSTTFHGFPGFAYSFYVEAFTPAGYNSGAPAGTAMASTTVSSTATHPEPFASMYGVDGFGLLHPASSPPMPISAAFPGWNIVRGIDAEASGRGGFVLDGWGGLHPYGDAGTPHGSGFWPGWDIARAVAPSPDGHGGFVLDGFGGLHRYSVDALSAPAEPTVTAYWNFDIARAMVTFPDASGGLVLDGYGGLHPFVSGSARASASVASGYWSGWDIARSLVLLPGSTAAHYAGYVLDGYGGLHPFASEGTAMPAAVASGGYWAGHDIARAALLAPGSGEGYVMDAAGAFWPFAGAPPVDSPNYGQNAPMMRAAAAA